MPEKPFCRVDDYFVMIPYRDFVKIAEMANEFESMKADQRTILEQNGAMRGMFSECLEKIAEIRDYVKDT